MAGLQYYSLLVTFNSIYPHIYNSILCELYAGKYAILCVFQR